MKKNIIIASGLVLTALIASYCGIWFFKTNQFKKEINNVVGDYKDNLTIGEIAISGFPLSQKIILKDVKFAAEKSSILIKNIEAQTSTFSSNYVIKILDPIVFEDTSHNISVIAELNPDSKISITLDKEESIDLKYSSSGYKILDQATKKVIIATETKDYESSLFISDKVVQYKHKDGGTKIIDEKNNVVFSSASAFFDVSSVTDENKKIAIKFDANLKDFENHGVTAFVKSLAGNQDINVAPTDLNLSPPESASGKSNFVVNGEVDLTPNGDKPMDMLPAEQMAKLPPEMKAQFQKKPAPYSVALNLKNFEFSNSLYKTTLNGTVNTYPEDNLPSGLVSLRIENFDVIVKELFDSFQKFSATNPDKFASMEDTISKTTNVLKELAAKNSQSTQTMPIFEIKRERNGGFNITINGVPFFEIMAEFMKSNSPKPEIH